MPVQKIIYVTQGEHNISPNMSSFGPDTEWELTKKTQTQLQRALDQVIIPEVWNDSVIFKSTGYNDSSWDTLNHLSYWLQKPNTPYIERDIFGKAEAWEIDNISKLKWDEEIVIFGTMHQDLKELIDSLKSNGYDVIDKESVKDRSNIYTLTVHLDGSKKTNFREFGWDNEE